MKVAIYIENGVTQLVLTPESDWERDATKGLQDGPLSVKRGSFYECRGGWFRQGMDDQSVLLVMDNRTVSSDATST